MLSLTTIPMIAYLGPGGILSGVGGLIALAGATLLAIVGFVWYPLKRWLRSSRSRDRATGEDSAA